MSRNTEELRASHNERNKLKVTGKGGLVTIFGSTMCHDSFVLGRDL